jgi:hypothetical protein
VNDANGFRLIRREREGMSAKPHDGQLLVRPAEFAADDFAGLGFQLGRGRRIRFRSGERLLKDDPRSRSTDIFEESPPRARLRLEFHTAMIPRSALKPSRN